MAEYKDPREEDIVYGDRRLSRPDNSLPDWEVPDSAYRPIPIVWFTGALLVQLVALPIVLAIFSSSHGAFGLAGMALVSGGIGYWTWQRGMATAPGGWKAATIIAMLFVYGMYSLLTLDRL